VGAGRGGSGPVGPTRRAALRAALAAAALAAASGCGLAAPRGRGSATQLSLLTDARLAPVAQALAQAYVAAGAATTAPLVRVAEPNLSVALQQTLGGAAATPADVTFITPEVRTAFRLDTVLINLGPALAAAGLGGRVYPQLLAYGQSGGKQVLLPLFRDPLVVFYNSDAFARAGVQPPTPQWDLARFTLLCQQLRERAPWLLAPLANATAVFDPEILTMFVVGFGGQLLGRAPGQTGYVARFADPAAVSAVSALAALRPFEPPSGAARPAAPRDLFASGQVALYFGHYRDVADLTVQIAGAFAWDVAPVPRGPIRRAQPVRGEGLAALVGDPQRRTASVALALFGMTPQAQEAIARTGLGVPALTSLADSPLWRQATPNLSAGVFVANADADVVVPEPIYYLPALQLAVELVARGSAPAYDALHAAAVASEFTLANWGVG
jgi:ABC-type glycerol-3-phosphate transport system substrate-binding protein